jgi:hypothetical protein
VDGLDAVEAIKTSGGEDESVAVAFFEFAKSRIDVAASFDEGDVGTESEDLRATARAGGADAATGGKSVKGPIIFADPGIAGVGAPGDGGDGELWSQFGGKVFERVDGEVDAAFFEGLFDLFNEDTLAVEIRRRNEAGLLHAVARGAYDLDLGGMARATQGCEDVIRLPEGKLGAPAANADRTV